MDANSLPSNIMDLRDEAFYDFIRQFAGKKVAELMSFQECNSVDSFLACNDICAILYLDSDALLNLKKSMCITLNNGFIYLLPGVEASIINLTKLFKKNKKNFLNNLNDVNQLRFLQLPPPSTLSQLIQQHRL